MVIWLEASDFHAQSGFIDEYLKNIIKLHDLVNADNNSTHLAKFTFYKQVI